MWQNQEERRNAVEGLVPQQHHDAGDGRRRKDHRQDHDCRTPQGLRLCLRHGEIRHTTNSKTGMCLTGKKRTLGMSWGK